MEESPPPKLHDSLDLTAVKAEADATQQRQKRNKRLSFYFFLACLAVAAYYLFLIIMLLVSPRSSSLSIGDSSRVLLVVSAIVYLIWRAIRAHIQHQAYLHRLRMFAPSFVQTAWKYSSIWFAGGWLVIAVALLPALAENLLSAFAVAWCGVYLVGISLVLLYRQWIAWTSRSDLQRIEQLLGFLPHSRNLLNFKATHLMNAGQLNEAEQIWRKLLIETKLRNIYEVGILLNNLGYCLTLAHKYSEALPILEASIQIIPVISYGYDNLAGWYLEQNFNQERALELSDFAVQLSNPKLVDGFAVQHVINARALALAGRDTRSEAILEKILNSSSVLGNPIQAEINRQVGYIRLAQNNREAAVEHFQKAVELDPDGIYGKLAQRALDSLAPPS